MEPNDAPPPIPATAKTCKKVFHDIEYTIVLSTDDNGLNIEASVGVSQVWRAHFTQSFIEEISRRAGNAKSFHVFLRMLNSALFEDSSSVYVDILTARDLDMLRQRQDMKPPNTKDSSNKRYLILTYQTAYDKVHYPLALQPVDDESPETLRTMIQELRNQLEKSVNTEQVDFLTKENERLRRDNEQLGAECEQLRIDLEASESRLDECEQREAARYNSGGADVIRRESAELRHAKASLAKHQNELKMMRDAKQRLVIDNRKECEMLRRQVTEGKIEIRRLQAQTRRGTSPLPNGRGFSPAAASRGFSPGGTRRPSPAGARDFSPGGTRRPSPAGARNSSPGVRNSVRSRPLSASSASSGSDCSNPSSLNRPTSSRYNRVLPTVPSHRVSPSGMNRRPSPANSTNSYRQNGYSPRTAGELPPRRRNSPGPGAFGRNSSLDRGERDRWSDSPAARGGRPTSATRKGSPELGRGAPPLPPVRRYSPPSQCSERSQGGFDRGKRSTLRSLSPMSKPYVSPYAQPSRPSPSRRLPPSSLNNSYDDRAYSGPSLLSKPTSQRTQSPINAPRDRRDYHRGGADNTQEFSYSTSSREREPERQRPEVAPSREDVEYREKREVREEAYEKENVRSRGESHRDMESANGEPSKAFFAGPSKDDYVQDATKAASPVRQRTGPELAPAVSDIDARLTALQNFLRNNQTVID